MENNRIQIFIWFEVLRAQIKICLSWAVFDFCVKFELFLAQDYGNYFSWIASVKKNKKKRFWIENKTNLLKISEKS
jgi:hypothetical protein